MKLSGTTALYAQLKELQTAVAVTEKQIAMAEEFDAPKPEKKTKRKRTAKTNGSEALIEAAANGQGFTPHVYTQSAAVTSPAGSFGSEALIEAAAKRILGPDLRKEM